MSAWDHVLFVAFGLQDCPADFVTTFERARRLRRGELWPCWIPGPSELKLVCVRHEEVGGGFGGVDAVGDAYAAEGVAGDGEGWVGGEQVVDSLDLLQMADVVLGHGSGPTINFDPSGPALSADQVVQISLRGFA